MRITKIVFLVSLLALVVVPAAWAIRFTDESYLTPTGFVGAAYSHKFEIAPGGGSAPYTYALLAGALPPGLTLSSSTGLTSGTPAASGIYSFWLEGKDCGLPCGSPQEATQREFTIKVVPGLNIQQNSLSPKTATFQNEPYSFQLTAEGGGTQTWSILSGAPPAGITLGSNGLLSGTPTVTGDFTFKIKVTDGSRSDAETYTLAVVPRLKISPLKVPAAEVGHPFTMEPKATGGREPYKWSLAGGTVLPSGFTLDPATGAISGLPDVVSSAVVKLSVTDTLGFSDTVDVSLSVAAKLAIKKKLLPAAKVGHKYKGRVSTVGGIGPFRYKVVTGKLPPNIHLNKRTGELSGTPSEAGTSRITVQVTDKLGGVSKGTFVLKVSA